MTTATMSRPATRSRTVTGHERDIASRLTKAGGQLVGVCGMYDNGRSRIDVLDQLSAVTAAIDAVAVLVLSDHINSCVRAAIASGAAQETVAELCTGFRRHVRSR